jgi:hypothetical protein
MAGYASGAASQAGEQRLKWSFMKLINKINANNPHWTPYAIPEAFR